MTYKVSFFFQGLCWHIEALSTPLLIVTGEVMVKVENKQYTHAYVYINAEEHQRSYVEREGQKIITNWFLSRTLTWEDEQ